MYQSVATCFLLLSFRGLDDVLHERCGQVGIRFVQVILENGIVRTMESSLPMARDSHSVWLSSAALALANGDLQVPGGVVELNEHGEPTGVLREESCWHFRDAYIETTDEEYVNAMRSAIKLANSRGVTAVHDKDGWLGALRFWQRLDAERPLSIRVWQSLPAEKADELADLGIASGFGNPRVKLGYLKAFMDGTLGSQTARLLDGSGVEITSREE